MSIALIPVTIRICDENATDKMSKLLKHVFDERSTVEAITEISGGMTNRLFLVTLGEGGGLGLVGSSMKCLIRIFGSGSDSLLDRDRGLEVAHALALHGLGPRIFARFTNGK